MIELASGNLLEADAEALVNTVNTVGVMGKGIALQFKQAFPENYEAYRRACKSGDVQLGRMFVFETGKLSPRYIVNFPTKKHWRARSRLSDIASGLDDLLRVVGSLGIDSIAVPPLGCGNGQLPWAKVRPLIESKLGGLPGVKVKLFAPTGAPQETSMPVGTRKPRMTAGRAALIGLMDRYRTPGIGVTQLEIQKLMYFLQTAGENLRLKYVKAKYGPYAESLNHVLQAVEGHYLRGYGDRTKRVADETPLELLPGAVEEARSFLSDHPATLERFERVQQLIDGFESPYGLELLSTVHWVATNEDASAASDVTITTRLVREWSARKKGLFTDRHIEVAWDQLRANGWLGTSDVKSARIG